ncbi:MAG TPA: hypothetical protein PL166_11925 [Candidatus Contendobacter sp.]|nr:hypothetical protein [Candidatus Contendobacter sp.]HRD50289.1 hypothetical protein [Candidatus Contendobacter sp.]
MPSTSLVLTSIEGEPRIHDLALAERLGFDRPRNIRNIIKRNQAKLLKFGVCSTVKQTSGDLGGRPTSKFYLNKKQSIFICMKSETDKAFEVQEDIIHVYDAYLNNDFHLTHSTATITPAQQAALHAIVARRSGEDGKIRAYFWSRFNNHFQLGSYKQLPAARFDEAVAYLEAMPLKGEKAEPPKPLPLDLNYPLESAAPPPGCKGLGYYAFAQVEGWIDPNWELLMKLRAAGVNVDGPIYSHQAKIHIMTAMYNALIDKAVESFNGACVSLPYAPVYIR